VELEAAVRYKPYRVNRIRTVQTPPCDSVAADALLAKVRELLEERMKLGLPLPFPAVTQSSSREILKYLDSIADPEQAADQISYAVLPEAAERQTILETIDVETRLRRLIQFLLAEIRRKDRSGKHE
jgi:ATP-dependent Lon protease